jgi:predicted acetyltransferase
MTIEVRPIGIEDWEPYSLANLTAFGWEANPAVVADAQAVHEFDRTLAAFEGSEIVGTTAIYSYDLTVPAGVLPMAGVTWVSVKPTHRRRGILRQIMQRQLADVHERNEPLAGLWASESVIYGRFGYGLAAQNMGFTIDRLRTALAVERPSCGRTRIVTREEALEAWPAVYDQARLTRPGFFSRNDLWWQHHTMRAADLERRAGARFYVQYEEDGRILGYARYRVRPDGGPEGPKGQLTLNELIALTDDAYAALWQYLFGVDLISTIQTEHRPVDEPLFWMLADSRRLVRQPFDSLWLRLVDVQAALAGRRYATSGRTVLDVRDRFCPWNEGRYELEAGADGASCRRTGAEPDITLSAADLGAAYLGGVRLSTLARAGRAEGDAAALRRADAIFAWEPLPWCPEVF